MGSSLLRSVLTAAFQVSCVAVFPGSAAGMIIVTTKVVFAVAYQVDFERENYGAAKSFLRTALR